MPDDDAEFHARFFHGCQRLPLTLDREFCLALHDEIRAAMDDGDWERACRLFREASDLIPNNLMFRQSLRGCAMKLSEQRRITLFDHPTHFARVKQALADQNWQQADRLAEDGLLYLPRDADLNAALARACYEMGYKDIAEWSCGRAIAADRRHAAAIELAKEIQPDWLDFL